MAVFVAIDALQNPVRRFVASGAEALDGGRRDVETPRLEHHRDDRETRERVVGGRLRRFPQPRVGRQRAVMAAKRAQSPVEQREVHRLVGRDAEPVVDESAREFKSEEHTSELQSLMRISYAVFFLKKKKKHSINTYEKHHNTH